MTSQNNLYHDLQILPNMTIIIPGCEPPSSVSSLRFASWYNEIGCDGGQVKVQDVLDAIPGSTIIYGTNFGPGNWRQKWLRLPPLNNDCPCSNVDYYGILKSLPKYKVEEPAEVCDIETADWCMSCEPDNNKYSGEKSPYVKMGLQSQAVGTLNQIPYYQID